MPLALNVIQKKKVLCSAEKSSVIWAEPHSRSSAEPNVWSVTTPHVFTKKQSRISNSQKLYIFNVSSRFRTRYVANSTPTFSPKKKLDFEFHDSSDAGKY